MIRLKQVNIESYRAQYKSKRGQAMSLYDEESVENFKERNQLENTFTKDKTKTWNRWRIPMKLEKIICMLIMLGIMLIGNTVFGVICPLCGLDYAKTNGYYSDSTGHKLKYYCTSCGGTYGPLQSHSFGSWTQTVAPTCTETGVERCWCSTCGYGSSRAVSALGHSWSSWKTDSEKHWKVCSRCGVKGSEGTHADTDANGYCDSCNYEMIIIENYQVGSKFYSTLANAIAGASAGNTIKIVAEEEFTDTSTATFNKNLTLDTNGKSVIKKSSTITIDKGVTVSITGSGTIKTPSSFALITNNGVLNISNATISNTSKDNEVFDNTGTLTINSGTITAKKLVVDNYGTLKIKGGTLKATSSYDGDWVRAVYSRADSEVIMSGGTAEGKNTSTTTDGYGGGICGPGSKTVTGGKITASGFRAIALDIYSSDGVTAKLTMSGSPVLTATSTVAGGYAHGIRVFGTSSTDITCPITISGGTVTATALTNDYGRALYVGYNSSTTIIKGGTFNGSYRGIHVVSGSGKLTYGDNTVDITKDAPLASGGEHGVYAADGFNFYNGMISGTNATPYSGTAKLRTNTEIIKETSSTGLNSVYLSVIRNYKIENTYYANLKDAIGGAKAGQTIIALRDNTDASTAVFDKNLTLNTNGKTITKSTTTITINKGINVSITGTGSILAGASCHVVTNNGTLNLSSARIRNYGTNTSYYSIYNTGTLNVNSGIVSSKYRAIYNEGEIYVKDGTIAATDTTFDSYKNAIYLADDSKLEITGGTIKAENLIENTTQSSHAITGMGDITISGKPIIASSGYNAFSINSTGDSAKYEANISISGTPAINAVASGGYAIGVRIHGESSDITLTNVTTTITGGTIQSTSTAAENNGNTTYSRGVSSTYNVGLTYFYSGTVIAKGTGIFLNTTAGKLTYGNDQLAVSKDNPSVYGEIKGIYAPGGFNFHNGVIKADVSETYTGTATIRTGNYTIKAEGPSARNIFKIFNNKFKLSSWK